MKGYFVIIGTLIVVVSVLITLNIFFQQSLQIEMAEQFNKQQLVISKSISENISAYIFMMKEEILYLSKILQMLDIHRQKELARLSDRITGHKTLIDADTIVLAQDGRILFNESGDNEKLRPLIPNILENSKVLASGEVKVFNTADDLVIITSLSDKVTRGNLLVFKVRIDDVANYYIAKIGSATVGHASIIDDKGNLLYHNPAQTEMERKNVYQADSSCFRCHRNFILEKRIVEGLEKSSGRYIAPFDENKVIAFSVTEGSDPSWIIAVSAPFTEVTHTTKESMKLYSYLIISILITTIAVSALLIFFNKKRIQAEEIEKRQEDMERYAGELENKVQARTAELASEKEKLDTIVGAIGSGIILFDKNGVIQWANQTVRDMSGTEVVGMTCEQLCADCEVTGAYSMSPDIETVLMSNLFGRQGKHFQVTTASVKGDDGEIHGYIRLIQDVTEMKRMEEQMTNSEKLASIGRLAAGIAHEIGNPLTSIFSFVQILREVEDDEFKKESLKTISFHINRISDILKQLSGFTKMPAGEAVFCKVSEVLESSLNLIQYDKKAKDITFVRKIEDHIPDILIDCNQLSQVFVNLILNSMDAMPQGGTLTARCFVRGDNVVIQFTDTGTGISKDDLSKIFDPFYTTKEKGTGLGLAVSYNIVKKTSGSITVASEPGKGTTFTITIPTKRDRSVAAPL